MAIVSWRVKCNFVANKGKTFVEGRVHFELAASKDEAEGKTRKYLEEMHYTDIVITDCHEETWEEKYHKLPKLPSYEAELKPAAPPQTQRPIVSDEDSDALF